MEKQKKLFRWACLLAAAVLITVHCVLTYRYGIRFINSDKSAELMLGKILADNNEILSKGWYYSTELRIFNMNLVYALAWKIMGSYTGVMVLSQAIALGLLYLSQVYFYKQAGLRHCFLYSLILLFPISTEYYTIVVFGLHYALNLSIGFVTLGMMLAFLKDKKVLWPGISFVLSVMTGMGGMRLLIMLYLPLFAATAVMVFVRENTFDLRRWKPETLRLIVSGTGNLAGALIGYGVNVGFLRRRYFFQSWQELQFDGVKINVIWKMIEDYFRLMGFQNGRVFSFRGIICILAAALAGVTAFLVIKALRSFRERTVKEQAVLMYMLFANLCILGIYLFSDLYYESRYYILVLAYLWPPAFMALESASWKMIKPVIITGIVVSVLLLTTGTYRTMLEKDETAQDREVTAFLMEQGYGYGFATFWHANVMNQLSEGEVTVCPIESLEKMNRYRWLTSEEILNPDWDGGVFLMIEDIEHDIYQYNNEILQNTDRIIYARNGRWVYAFESYEEFARYLKE